MDQAEVRRKALGDKAEAVAVAVEMGVPRWSGGGEEERSRWIGVCF